ncbi:hypothetical protein RB597_007857 [Gaeumannomyces tritici]
MRTSVALAAAAGALLVQAAPSAKNFIYVVPDGFGTASQTMARDYVSLLRNGGNPGRPVTFQLPADKLVMGNVRTQASDNLVTDSAASATAFACGIKTFNGALGVNDARYSSHVSSRDSYSKIAEHQIGYSHPFGPFVDILLGGGRCYYKPQGESGSCRSDDVDLFGFARQNSYHVMQDRSAFDAIDKGLGSVRLPFIGLFNDKHLMYEVDRARAPEREPSLLEMAETALNALDRGTASGDKGYFLMIEASRIDHAGHANDPAAHLHDIVMYNNVLDRLRSWIDDHPDTMLMSAADHETGGLTLRGYNPLPLGRANASTEALTRRFAEFAGPDAERAAFFRAEILPAYGLADATDAEVATLLASGSLAADMGNLLGSRAGVHFSTGGHTAADVVLYGYAAAGRLPEYKADMAGNWDNTELPKYIERVLGVDMGAATERLRANGTGWVGTDRDRDPRLADVDHIHGHD